MKPGRNDACPCGSGKKFKKCCQNKIEAAPALEKLSVKTAAPSTQEVNALTAHFTGGRFVQAEALARTMTEQFPLYGFGWMMNGLLHRKMGRGADAVLSLQRAATLSPDDADIHYNLGNALHSLGKLDEAVKSYRRALQVKPDFAMAHSNLGNVLHILGQSDEAVQCFHQALEIKPDFAEAHYNLGNTQQSIGRLEDAAASYRRTLELRPDLADAHFNLGNTLKTLGRLGDAETSYRHALKIRPDFADAYNNSGAVQSELGQLNDALTSYRRALELKPDFADAHNNLGNVLKDIGELDAAEASYRRALEFNPDYVNALSNLLFMHNYRHELSPTLLLDEARRFGELVTRQAHPYTDWHNVPEPGKRLRVGLVSGDLRHHPVGYFLESVLEALASNASDRLELIAYSTHFRPDTQSERIKACCQGWHSAVGLSDESLARLIRDDGIDMLLDLSGHTAHNRLPMFAWKPAPVQVSWLGYFATTGVSAIDYLIADPWTLPQAEAANFTEKICYLPETRLCFTPPDVEVAVSPLPALANGHITFGCFNNLTKMNDTVVALWARVLASIPDSRLFLKSKQLNEASVRQSIIGRYAVHGIGADRLILEGESPRAKYLAAYHRVDIALDPFPYTGGTTSVEGLWMGVPVLTLAGERFLSRQGVGLLMNAGLPEWIAADADDYVACAVTHAGDLQRLAALRSGLRQQVLASPLFDAPRFARHFEVALRGMWTQWCKQQQDSPSHAER